MSEDDSDSLLRALAHAPPQEPPTILSGNKGSAAAEPWPFSARFRLTAELARGGMGRVLLVHDLALQREVAIKELLRPGPQARRRFEREALLTARLQHPGIVSVYEVVRRETGEPALVMRRVQGKPFDQVLAAKKTLAERLALLSAFIAACDAVAYAHKARVIHRDLKPQNVLVGDFGDTVVVDWGLAKDLGAASTPGFDELDTLPEDAPEVAPPAHGSVARPLTPELTAIGAVIGTPAYMSPEQARGEPADARTDVYALGAMLYELLAGERAFSGEDTGEVLEAVRRGPPPPLSSRVPELAPELATLVARAMAREPRDRFANAGELAEELKRFQSGLLLRSHEYGTRELVWRWVRRHAALLSASAAFAVLLAIFGVASVRRILVERDRANRAAVVSQQISTFITGMFETYDPNRGSSVTAEQIVDKASSRIERELSSEPLVQAQLWRSLGEVLRGLGLYEKSRSVLEKSVEIRRAQLGPEHPETIDSLSELSMTLSRLGRYAEAEKLDREVLAVRQRLLGTEHPDTVGTLAQLATDAQNGGRNDEAERILKQVLETRRRTLGPEAPETLRVAQRLASIWYQQGRDAEAEAAQRELVAASLRVNGASHPATFRAMQDLANTLDDLELTAEAEKLYRQALDGERRVLGPDHADTLTTMQNLADCLDTQGRWPEAETLLREALAARTRILGADHPQTLMTASFLTNSLRKLGRLPEAEATARAVLAGRARVLGPEHPTTVVSMLMLSRVLDARGSFAESEGLLFRAVEIRRRVFGPDHAQTMDALDWLARHEERCDRPGEAEALFRQVLTAVTRTAGKSAPDTLNATISLAHDLDLQGRHAEAEPLLRAVIAEHSKDIAVQRDGAYALAESLERQCRDAEAEPLRRTSLEAQRARLGPESPGALSAAAALAGTLLGEGRAAEAEAMLVETLAAQRRVEGDHHSDVLDSQVLLARARSLLGRFDESEQALRAAIGILRDAKSNQLGAALFELGCEQARRGAQKSALEWLAESVAARPNTERAEALEQRPELASLRRSGALSPLIAKARKGPVPH